MTDNDVAHEPDPQAANPRGAQPPRDHSPSEDHPVTVIEPREVPLGGPRAMTVRRTLPARRHTTIGAFCFLDHYGPDDVSETGGMDVHPHPHTGLQTVSWLFSGMIEHRDSTGVVEVVHPGHLNLMTAGRGVSHSEVTTPETTILHGVQLWTVLPDESRWGEPGFVHHEPPFREPIVMWWNFIGRTHEEVVEAREQWQAEISGADPERFGRFDFPGGGSIPAPPLPMVRLLPRGSRHTQR